MIDMKDISICNVFVTLFRRLPIDSNFINILGNQGLFKNYLLIVSEDKEEKSINPCLLFFDTIISINYHKDYLILIEQFKKWLKIKNFEKIILIIIYKLCNYNQCIKEFKNQSFLNYFNKKLKDNNTQEISIKILKKLSND